MNNIRRAEKRDAARLAEIEVFNYRLNFYPIFKCDEYYFGELSVPSLMENYLKNEGLLNNSYVYDDGVVKGFVRIDGREAVKLFVEPALQGNAIGEKLLEYAVKEHNAEFLWALEKNSRAIRFYERNGFHITDEKKLEDDTEEYLVKLKRHINPV